MFDIVKSRLSQYFRFKQVITDTFVMREDKFRIIELSMPTFVVFDLDLDVDFDFSFCKFAVA